MTPRCYRTPHHDHQFVAAAAVSLLAENQCQRKDWNSDRDEDHNDQSYVFFALAVSAEASRNPTISLVRNSACILRRPPPWRLRGFLRALKASHEAHRNFLAESLFAQMTGCGRQGCRRADVVRHFYSSIQAGRCWGNSNSCITTASCNIRVIINLDQSRARRSLLPSRWSRL